MNFIDITGQGNSGKGALVDLLREVDGFYVPEWFFEFDFIRVNGGLLDLRRSLVDDWSPIRAHAAYHNFLEVADMMGRDPKPWQLWSFMKSTPQRYDKRFDGQFRRISTEFVNQFRVGSYKAEWPFDALREGKLQRALKRIGRRLGLRQSLLDEVILLDGLDFDDKAKTYVETLYLTFLKDNQTDVVLNNAFDPFNPCPGLDMLSGKQIFVTRDPRDVYVSGLNSAGTNDQDQKLLGPENDGLSKTFLATDDLELFVQRFKLINSKIYVGQRKDIMHLAFEDLILDYDKTLQKILKFLDIDPDRHKQKRVFLDPERSRKNVGLWKKSSRTEELNYITEHLGEYILQ